VARLRRDNRVLFGDAAMEGCAPRSGAYQLHQYGCDHHPCSSPCLEISGLPPTRVHLLMAAFAGGLLHHGQWHGRAAGN
jgi:hypothetical protein